MTSPFAITPTPPTSHKLEVGEDGTFSFTVTSLAAPDTSQELVLEALVIGPDGKGRTADWLVVGPSRTLTLGGGATTTVTITARPRTTSPRGVSRIQLAVADNERPHDIYAYSPPVTCEVTDRPVVATPPPKRPRWLIPVIAGGAVVVGLNIVLVILLVSGNGEDSNLGKRCDAQTPCRGDLICADVGKCLRPERAACKDNDECASRQCAGGVCVTATPGAFTVVLVNPGVNKIAVIKVVREVTALGLKEAKDLVDGAPSDVKVGVNKAEAVEIAQRLREVGADVEIR